MPSSPATVARAWPTLPSPEWAETCATLHMWFQVAGKIRMSRTPSTNHSWHVTLYVTSRGLTTSLIPDGPGFQIDFDFIDHELLVRQCDGQARSFGLPGSSVAEFYANVMTTLRDMGHDIHINTRPNEVENAIPFDEDTIHAQYDPDHAHRYWQALVQADRVFTDFRARFIGKNSPVHFFWGGPDLAVTRFSGRTAPRHKGGFPNLPDAVTREAYSHEVSSCGYWPGNAEVAPLFYAYAYPEPQGFKSAAVRPKGAVYYEPLGEFILPYDEVRQADEPDAALLEFLQSTYEAAADLAGWDRAALERERDAGVNPPG